MYCKFSLLTLFLGLSTLSNAQTKTLEGIKNFELEHLDVSAGLGTMGLTLEASTPINDLFSVRAGLSWMPTISTVMGFGVQVGEEEDKKYDAQGNRRETKFDKMSGYLEQMTGYQVDDRVDMACKASYLNAKVMVDVTPFENKDWHLTAGFYWGTKKIGRACNTTEDMTTTMAVGIYNTMYEKIANLEPIFSGMTVPPDLQNKILSYGKMGMHVGDFKNNGTPYMMVPAEDGTVKAWAKVNSFKPYLGAGWNHTLSSYPDWTFCADAGIVFWGGVPNVYTHDGTSLTKDVKNLDGKVGRIISFVKGFPVFPMLEVRISKRIF